MFSTEAGKKFHALLLLFFVYCNVISRSDAFTFSTLEAFNMATKNITENRLSFYFKLV